MLGHLGAMLGHLGATLGHLGPMLCHLGAMLGLSWAILGLVLGHLGAMLGLCWVKGYPPEVVMLVFSKTENTVNYGVEHRSALPADRACWPDLRG